ncbi:hypothetical protein [Rhodoblastus sp.]|uniref:hypothetical protein n=1 Tax=Rhodoblastus sp. TaxID=1962975 RepID=UPI003F9BE608
MAGSYKRLHYARRIETFRRGMVLAATATVVMGVGAVAAGHFYGNDANAPAILQSLAKLTPPPASADAEGDGGWNNGRSSEARNDSAGDSYGPIKLLHSLFARKKFDQVQ